MTSGLLRCAFVCTLIVLALACTACGSASSTSPDCGTYNGKQLYIGPEGGCYYINDKGNKIYVDRGNCKC